MTRDAALALSKDRLARCTAQIPMMLSNEEWTSIAETTLCAMVHRETLKVLAYIDDSQEVAELKRELAELNETFKFTLKTKEELQSKINSIQDDLGKESWNGSKGARRVLFAHFGTNPTPSEDEAKGMIDTIAFDNTDNTFGGNTNECLFGNPKGFSDTFNLLVENGYDPSCMLEAIMKPDTDIIMVKRP